MNKILEKAISYAKRGWIVIPLNKKTPLVKKWQKITKQTLDQVEDLWVQYPDANVGIVTGLASKIIVLDVDAKSNGFKTLEALEAEYGKLPNTLRATTGGGGKHYYFRYPNIAIKNSVGKIGKGLDIRSDGGQVVAPPSVHENGNEYKWDNKNQTIVEIPAWLLDKIVLTSSEHQNDITDPSCDILEGARNSKLTSIVGKLWNGGLEIENIRRIIKHENKIRCKPPLDDQEVETILKSISSYPRTTITQNSKNLEDSLENKEEQKRLYTRNKIGVLRVSGYNIEETRQLLKADNDCSDEDILDNLIDEMFAVSFDQLLNFINRGSEILPEVELFRDQKDIAYSRFTYRGANVIAKVRSSKFKNYVRHRMGSIKRSELDCILDMLEAEALMEKPQYNLNYRVAQAGKTFYYDLGNLGIVQIDKDGWRVLKQEKPIIFRQSPLFKNQVEPQLGGTIDLLFKYINITDESEKVLVIAFITSALVAEIPKPILALSGSQGSAKTTTQKLIAEIIDPSLSQDSHIRDIRELLLEASQRYVLPFDNLSYIKEADSDLLCKMVTGTTFSKRQLYTDEESILFTPHNAIMLNGISLPVNRSDLLSRCIIISLPRITDTTRRDESSLFRDFAKDKPFILGAFLSLLSKAMELYDSVEIEQLPRMADYAKWGCAVCKAQGMSEEDFEQAYDKNTKIQHEESVDSSMLGQIILSLLEKDSQIQDNPTSLLKNIREYAKNNCQDLRYLPSSPNAMGKELKRIAPNLEALGIKIEQIRGKSRKYIITKQNLGDKGKKTTTTYYDNSAGSYSKIQLLERLKEINNEN